MSNSKVDLLVTIGIIALLGLVIVFVIWISNAPCSEFESFMTKDVPVRCLKYYTEGGE